MRTAESLINFKYVTNAGGDATDVLIPLAKWQELLSSLQQLLARVEKDADTAAFREILSKYDAPVIAAPKGVSGKALLRHVGVIPRKGAARMRQAIEAECERIDRHEW